jgi:hypothetical protein
LEVLVSGRPCNLSGGAALGQREKKQHKRKGNDFNHFWRPQWQKVGDSLIS